MRYLRYFAILISGLCPLVLWRSRPSVLKFDASHTSARGRWRSIAAGQAHTYAIDLHAGQFARVLVEQRDIDLRVGGSFPDGSVLPALSGSEYGYEAINLIGRLDGRYFVKVMADTDDSARGAYRIWLAELRIANPRDEFGLQAHRLLSGAVLDPSDSATEQAHKIQGVQRSAALWHSAGDPLREARALNILGRLFQRTGQIVEAQTAHDSALRIFRQIGDEYGQVETLKLRANLGSYFGEERAPLPVLKQYLAIWQRLGDRRGQAMLLSAIASCLRRTGNYARAIELETIALKEREAFGNHSDIADSLNSLAILYIRTKRLSQAIDCSARALEAQRESGDRHQIGAALSSLGVTLANAQRYSEAIRYLRESLTIKCAEGDRTAAIGTYVRISQMEKREGDLSGALADNKKARGILEGLSREIKSPVEDIIFRRYIEAYHDYVWILMGLHSKYPTAGYDQQAFLATDYERARYVTSTLFPSNLRDLTNLLDSRTVLIEYGVNIDSTGIIWVLTRSGLTTLSFEKAASVPDLARTIVQGMSEPNSASAPRTAAEAELSHLLLNPIASRISGMRIVFVSDESFGFLPLGYLADPNRQDGAPLIRGHEVVYLPAAAAMLGMQRATLRSPLAPPSKRIAIVADPVFDAGDPRLSGLSGKAAHSEPESPDVVAATRSAGWDRDGKEHIPPLPFARKEATEVASDAPSGGVTEYLGFRASRNVIMPRLADYGFVHFVTHGLVNASDPELSGLILSLFDRVGRRQEGFLSLTDIYALRLRANLVTLSACQTSLGNESQATG